ncbi:MAG: DUF6288 domain-containing protein [Verrucomicrobia bacterium]|nr:DUF6288 domain-containing protein [Verrucomicrobiota bacterium]
MKQPILSHHVSSALKHLALAAVGVAFLGASPTANALPPVTSGLALFFDASQLVGNNGDPVSPWTDLVASKNATTDNASPTLTTGALNGLNVVTFSGSQDLKVAAGDSPINGKQQFTVAVVFKPHAAGAGTDGQWYQNSGLVDAEQPGVTQDWGLAWNGNSKVGAGIGNGDHTLYSAAQSLNTGHVAIYSWDGTNGGAVRLSVDGTTSTTATGSTAPRNSYQILFGRENGTNNYFSGGIAEILIYTRTLTTDEERVVGSYLAQKYRLVTTYVPLALTANVTSPTNNQAFPFGTDVTASATAQSGTGPYTVTFYQKSGAGAAAPVGSPQTAAGPTFTQDLGVLGSGSYQVYATVTDSASPTPATATSATNTFTVAAPTSTATTLGTSGTSTYGQTATFTATVAPTPNGGTVQFYSDGNPLGTPVAVNTSTGAASYGTTLLTAPTHSITAHYSGFGVYLASDAAAIPQTVNRAALTVTADNKIRSPGDANPAFTYVISGFQNGENATSAGVTGAPILGTAADTNSPAGNYPITNDASPMAAANYSFTGVAGSLKVVAGAPPSVANANVACWYDAAQGVTASGGNVTKWNDQSGNGHDATTASGTPTLVASDTQITKPAIHLRGASTYFNCAGGMFTKEQYLVVRSPNAIWNGSGSFLGRSSADFLTVRASSYNLYSGQTGFWDDQLPSAVSKNGTAMSSGPGSMPRGGFQLGTITDYMILKITVNNGASAANLAAYPYYQIGKNETLGTMDFDVAEIIGYDAALSAEDETKVGGYLAGKYKLTTTYLPATTSTTELAITAGSTPAVVGSALTFTATVFGTAPSGSVTFFAGTTSLGTTTLNASAQASLTTSSLAVGTYSITAQYAGDSGNTASTSGAVPVQIANPNDIVTFTFPGPSATVIEGTAISVTLPSGTDVTALAPTYTTVTGATGVPTSGTVRNFTTPQTYVINGTKTYTVTVTVIENSAKDILACNFGSLGAPLIDGTSIVLGVPSSQSRLNLAPTFTLSLMASISPASGSSHDFTNPVTYTVTANDGSTKAYTVSVVTQAPDLTLPGTIAAIDAHLDDSSSPYYWTYNLGPSGMRGYIYHNWPVTARQDAFTALGPWQILVTSVGANTPASGIMAKDDVILGVSTGAGTPVPLFASDARESFGMAITAAEAGDGVMKLKRWRAGVTADVSIQLQVLGTYSDTAPYACPKSALILTQAANSLQQRILQNGWSNGASPGSISALALLATGDPKYLPMLQAYARSLAPPTLNLEQSGGISAWSCYESIFLAEYYMLTGDPQVFHGLSEYVIYAATHQSMFGTAGHGFSNVPPPGGWLTGGTHGLISWYGPVNQAGLVAQLSIVLGKKAGVTSPEIDPAIERAANFFGYYVNRGSIPYGEHQPYCGDYQLTGQSRTYYDHRSNGKDGLAAVLFACMGDKPLQTEYFTRMAVAGYTGEQYGHTGQGFSYLWMTLGANVGGTTAVAEYLKPLRWHRDFTRRCDGSFAYDGGEQFGCSHADDYWAYTTYYDNPTAYYVLHAALPLKKLCITGKNANPANELGAQEVANALAAATFTPLCGGYSTSQLVAALGEWDPIVRFNAATELSVRPDAQALIPTLITMAENPSDANQREAACTALGCMGATSAIPALVRRLSDPEIWVRAKAAKALGSMGSAPVSSVPAMMAAFVANVAPTYPFQAGFNWDDPLQIGNGYLSETLFGKLGSYSISTDKGVLYPAVRAGIKQPAGMWRNQLSDFVQNKLTLADIEALMPEILTDASTEGPCDRMFTLYPPQAAMNALSKYHIQEGARACADNVAYSGSLANTAIQRLADYGEAARWSLPDLYADLGLWTHDNNYNTLAAAIASIEAATTSPALLQGLPTADPQVVSTAVNAARALTLTGSTCRAGTLTYTVATQPAHGNLTGTPPSLTYTPAANYQGMDRFTFTVTDSLTDSSPATVDMVVGAGGTGLQGRYYDNVDFTSLAVTQTDTAINFDWAAAAPASQMGANTYSVRWTGQVLAPETGTYRFSTRTSDGVRLWINGVLVINDWNDQASNIWNDSAPIALTVGQKYSLKMEYYRNVNPATVRLYWYRPSRQGQTIIPQELLYPVSGVSLTSPADGARFGMPATVTLTADVADAGTITSVAYYNGDALIGSTTTPPYSFAWTNVPGGQYSLTARATDSTGAVSTSAVAVITVDLGTVPYTTGLVCYFDASVGVTTNANGAVAGWSDRSGNGHHASLGNGMPVLVSNQLNSRPVLQFRGNSTWLNTAGTFFAKEQYVVVRSPNATWSGSGSFLGRSNTTGQFLAARPSSFNLYSGQTGFWDDWLPSAVSKNGTAVSSAHGTMPRGGFQLGSITDFMLLKITVQDTTQPVGNVTYQIGQNDNLGSCEMDVAEIIAYDSALSAANEAKVGSYLTKKYGLTTAYPVTKYSSTTLALTGGGTPSAGGTPLTFSATVSGSTPTGSVSFRAGTTLIGTRSLDGAFQASLTTSSLAAGTYAITAEYAGDAKNDASVSTPVVIEITSSPSLYAIWAAANITAGHPGADATPGGNPDGDSMSNLMEYACGTNPIVASGGPIAYVAGGAVTTPGLPVTINFGGSDYRAVFGRRKDYLAAGLTYTVQFSVGLDAWVDSTDTPTLLTAPASAGDMDAVSVPYPSTIPTASGPRHPTFFRLRVSNQASATPLDGFAQWINGLDWSGFVNPDKTSTGDPGHDGMTNFEEYAFGLDPTKGASANPIKVPLDKTSATFTYTRRATPAATGLVYTVWTSPDLVTWSKTAYVATEGAITTANGVETVPVTLSGAPLSAARLFVRVTAE